MPGERKALDFNGLDDFEPRKRDKIAPIEERKAIDKISTFPSRERSDEGQINIRAPSDVLQRFRQMAKKERYTLGAFLEILMKSYDNE